MGGGCRGDGLLGPAVGLESPQILAAGAEQLTPATARRTCGLLKALVYLPCACVRQRSGPEAVGQSRARRSNGAMKDESYLTLHQDHTPRLLHLPWRGILMTAGMLAAVLYPAEALVKTLV